MYDERSINRGILKRSDSDDFFFQPNCLSIQSFEVTLLVNYTGKFYFQLRLNDSASKISYWS